jgi:hypothetical protein
MRKLPINPAHFVGCYALEYVTHPLSGCESIMRHLLTISFETRTDSTSDPLIEGVVSLATEFMDLAGIFSPSLLWQIKPLTSDYAGSVIEHCRLYRTTSQESKGCVCTQMTIRARETVQRIRTSKLFISLPIARRCPNYQSFCMKSFHLSPNKRSDFGV